MGPKIIQKWSDIENLFIKSMKLPQNQQKDLQNDSKMIKIDQGNNGAEN